MTPHMRSLLGSGLLVSLALWSPRPMRAQAELLPAVAISAYSFAGQTWPGRFNPDGITDIVGTHLGDIAVRFGKGDGTFGEPVRTPVRAHPVRVGDINRDGLADVIAVGREEGPYTEHGPMYVLRGKGDGTFAVAAAFPQGGYTFAQIDDFDRDGHRDLIVGDDVTPSGHPAVHVFRGFGDFTFAPPITYETGPLPIDATVADVNNDTLPDVVVASHDSFALDIFVNRGGLLFSRDVVRIERAPSDVAARDLNGDGRTDLVVSARLGHFAHSFWYEGFVYVYLGQGNGTFAAPTIYETPAGTQSVVIGDFTRDGRLDIATVNRSAEQRDDSCGHFFNVDSASILAGNGNGTFRKHTSFALSSQRTMWESEGMHSQVASLNTNDLDGDGHTDLLASHGIVLLNRAPRENRPPVAFAGEDVSSMGSEVFLPGGGADPDGHWLTFGWQHGAGNEDVPAGAFGCFNRPNQGANILTLTADDGVGGRASDSMTFVHNPDNQPPTVQVVAPAAGAVLQAGQPFEIQWTMGDADGRVLRTWVEYSEDGVHSTRVSECDGGAVVRCRWTVPSRATEFARLEVFAADEFDLAGFAQSGRFSVRSASGGNSLPQGFFSEDIGAVGIAGGAAYTTGVYTVTGSGADVWGTADELHFAYRRMDGDFDFVARVAAVQNVNKWTKAGLMVREHTGAGSRHAFAFATPRTERGIAFQRRPTEGGASLSTAGPAVAPPALLHLRRRGDTVEASYRPSEADPWVSVGRQTFDGLSATLLVGFGVSSHVDGTRATARFDHVSLLPPQTGGGSLDIGAVGAPGRSELSSPPHWNVVGSGADVWGAADKMHYAYTHVEGDFDVSARVRTVENINRWTKAGLMIRETVNAGSRHAFAIATPRTERGVVFQRRQTTNGISVSTAGPAWAPPVWLKLSRRGDVITAHYRRTITDVWVQYGTQSYSGLPDLLLAGFGVSSHVDGITASAGFDLLSIDPVR